MVVATPVIPILDEAINGNLALAVFLRDGQKFGATGVMFLALPVTIGPFAIHRGRPGQVSVSGDDRIHVGAGDEIIIHVVGHFRPQRHFLRIIGKDGFGIIVPQNAIAHRGNQERRDRVGVGLDQFDSASAIIHVTVLMLAQAVKAFLRRQDEILLHTERVCLILRFGPA